MNDISIGETKYTDDLTIPLGTIMRVDGEEWTREAYGWHGRGARIYPRVNGVRHMGEVIDLIQHVETLAQYQQRFAVTCLHQGTAAGGGGYRSGAESIVESLDIGNPEVDALRIGSWVSAYVNLRLVPEGAVLLVGDALRHHGHSLAQMGQNQMLSHIGGPRRPHDFMLYRVVALPEGYVTTPWPEPEGDQREAITRFQLEAWDRGWREKQERSWCTDYEASMSVLSLDSAIAERLRRGLPEGVVLVPLVGDPVQSHAQLESMPVGTVITEGRDSYTAVKQADGRWATEDYPGDVRLSTGIYVHSGLTYWVVPVVAGQGSPVDSERQRSMAPGAVFLYNSGSRYVWARTTDEHAHRDGNIGLTPGLENVCVSNAHVTVVWDGVSPIRTSRVGSIEDEQVMPVGTIIGQHPDGEGSPMSAWIKVEADSWATLNRDGSHSNTGITSEQLGHTHCRYFRIPVPGMAPTPVPGYAI